jgi:DTW domain-containing protein YfiP
MMSLRNVRLNMHGVQHQPTQWPTEVTSRPLCVLFPSEDATELTVDDQGTFDRLIVLDGNWRQAKKAANRIAKACQPVFKTLPKEAPSEFRLRKQSEAGRLSTFEATARALSILESPSYEERMMPLFRAHVSVTMEARSRRGWHQQKNQNTSHFSDREH